jgi:hypothetical protein
MLVVIKFLKLRHTRLVPDSCDTRQFYENRCLEPHISWMKRENRKMLKNLRTSKNFCDISTLIYLQRLNVVRMHLQYTSWYISL